MTEVSSTPSPGSRSQTISAVHDASSTTWLTVPKRVLSWWWSRLRIVVVAAERLGRVALDVAAVEEDGGALGDVGRELAS